MRQIVALALGLLFVSCGRRNFNDGVVDAAPLVCTPPAAGCTNGTAYVCGGVCYVYCTNTVSRPAAAATCESWGGCLSVIESQAANNCVASEVTDQTWIGALQDNNATDTSASWRWCDGALISYRQWSTGAPDDADDSESGEEQCAAMYPTGDWFDTSCSGVRRFCCSRPL